MIKIADYDKEWTDNKEIDWIEHIGFKRNISEGGKYLGIGERLLPDAEIISILEGYIRGAHHKDWNRCGLSEGKCIKAAMERLQHLQPTKS
jgi:hypothetical protein